MLLRFFPVPLFLNMQAAGLALSDTNARLLRFDHEDGGLVVSEFAEVALANGIIESGVVKDPIALAKALSEIRAKTKNPYVNVSLPEEKAFLFRTKIESLEDEEDTRSLVEFQIREQVPLPASEIVFDYMTLGKTKDGKCDVVVSVLSNNVIGPYLEALKLAGFTALSLEIESQAVADALIKNDDENAYIIVNIEDKQTGFFIVDNGIVQFTSTISIDKKEIIDQAISSQDSTLKKEIEKLKIYWDSHIEERYQNAKAIEKIMLSGEHGDNHILLDTLGKQLDIDIGFGNVWVNAFSLDKYVPPIKREDSFKFAEAVGLALSAITRY